MPAVTVNDLTVLDRLRAPGLGDQPRPVWQVTTAPAGLRGGGLPGPPRLRRHRPRPPRPVRDDGPDGRGGVRARVSRRARPWHPHRGFETVTYIIDGTFDHQDSHGGGGTHHQRRHPVDDRRRRHPPHRGPAGVAGPAGRPVPRHPALGEPAARRQDERAEVPGPPLRRGRAWSSRPTRARWCGSSPATSTATPAPGATFTPMSLVHATIEPGARLELPWDVDFNALVYVLNGQGTVGTDARPIRMGQSAVFGAGDFLTIAADGSQESRSPKMDVIVVGGQPDPRAPRLGRPVRDEHQVRGHAGLRGLPARQLRPHPWLSNRLTAG